MAFLCFLPYFCSLFYPRPPCGLLFLLSLTICPILHLLLPSVSVPVFYLPSPHPLPPSLPTVGKWRVARVPVWTGTPLGAVARPGPNSLAPVVMWTSSRRLPRQHHLHCSVPSTSIRKMDKPPLHVFLIGRVHSRDRLSNSDC